MPNYEPFTADIEQKLRTLTLEEKIRLCHGSAKFSIEGVPRVGIPDIVMSDGPHGVRREISRDSWDPVDTDEDYSTYLPVGTAVAATWNPEMGKLHGSVLGAEARERGKDIILGPGFNIIRTPLCGRNFEYYSEDPYLICQLVPGVIQSIQSQGTAACVKHFACNSQELNRHKVNALPSERALREIYLPGFKTAVEAGALTVMGAYNKFRGQWCCQNDTLLNEILKKEWGFSGATVSDWNGVCENTYEPALNGMDMEMGTVKPYNEYYLADPFRRAIESGEIEVEVLDDKVRRILYVLFSIGAMGERKASRPKGSRNTEEHQKAALTIAEEAIVLLKNENNVLPFPEKVRKVLVVGDNASIMHHGGGASSAVKALYEITPLEGIRNLLKGMAEVEYLPDPAPPTGFSIPTDILSPADIGAGVNGWKGLVFNHRQYFPDQKPVHEFAANEVNFSWEDGLPEGVDSESDWHMAYLTTLTAPKDGSYQFVLHGAQESGFHIDDEPVILKSETESEPNDVSATVELKEGRQYQLLVYIVPREVDPLRHVSLNWIPPGESSEISLSEVAKKAAEADAVIYVGGLTHQEDTEGKDRRNMALPGLQNKVIPALAAANDRFAALMVSGSPYEMPWIDEVPAVVQLWFNGMEAGTAAAEVLFGRVNPSGKLPFTFPVTLGDSPAHYLNDYDKDVCYYKEDIFTGYRWYDKKNIEPLFCFGHGLSYTDFRYADLNIKESEDSVWTVAFTIANTGTMAGAEVAQLYLKDCECSVARPEKELKGFRKIFLQPGEIQTVSMDIKKEDLSFFHPTRREWMTEDGEFGVFIGSSSCDIRLNGKFLSH